MIHNCTLLQDATDIVRKFAIYFITKCDRKIIQNAFGFLLQSATILLQNETVLQNVTVNIKSIEIFIKQILN